jgi:hypothetical protein
LGRQHWITFLGFGFCVAIAIAIATNNNQANGRSGCDWQDMISATDATTLHFGRSEWVFSTRII